MGKKWVLAHLKLGLWKIDKANLADEGSVTLRVFLSGGGGDWYIPEEKKALQ